MLRVAVRREPVAVPEPRNISRRHKVFVGVLLGERQPELVAAARLRGRAAQGHARGVHRLQEGYVALAQLDEVEAELALLVHL